MARVGQVESERIGWSAAVPFVCAVHCLATPVLVLFAPSIGGSPILEAFLMSAALVVTVRLVGRGWRRHARAAPWLGVAAGAGLWVVELIGVPLPLPDAALTVGGSLLLAGALFWSGSLSSGHCLSSSTRSPTVIPRSAK